tara:strand:- start:252 stop:461 length:210 start_codon:yes stop_codon:yes gene_type:complete
MKKPLTINIIILTVCMVTGCKTPCLTCNTDPESFFLKTQKVEDPKGDFEHGWNASIDNAIHIIANKNEN